MYCTAREFKHTQHHLFCDLLEFFAAENVLCILVCHGYVNNIQKRINVTVNIGKNIFSWLFLMFLQSYFLLPNPAPSLSADLPLHFFLILPTFSFSSSALPPCLTPCLSPSLSHAPPRLSSRGEDGAMRCNYSNWL